MKFSRRLTIILLCALFVAAIAARVSTTNPGDSPYYKGASAMSYRHALIVADGKSLRAPDAKAGHPEGYIPARYRASGMETITGLALRAARWVSDIDGRPFTRRCTVVVAALCVFPAYAVAAGLWASPAAGWLAAALVAFLPTLVTATNGRAFSHIIYASFLVSLHAAMALRALAGRSRLSALGAGIVALILFSLWEPAAMVVAAWMIPVALSRSLDRSTRISFTLAHALALVVAGALFPHLVATRALAGWTAGAAVSAAIVAALPERLRSGWRAAAWLVAGTAVLTVVGTPIRSGAIEQFPALGYLATRVRYAFGRPEPSLLSEWMRHVWSIDHAPLTPHQMIQVFVPIGLLAFGLAINRAARDLGGRFVAGVVVLVIAAAAVALDRSAIPLACPAMIVAVAGCACSLPASRWTRGPLVAVAVFIAFAGIVAPGSSADPAFQLAKATGVVARDPYAFVRLSLENTDRELVRFMSTRTSVRESVLAPEDLSALLVAFTGRTSVQLCGSTSRLPAEKHVLLTRALYRDEATFYQLCREMRIDYVVYSVDVLLDHGDYSPLYLAGAGTIDPNAIAVRMHFEPESIEHFTLIYENDNYRLFKVSESMQPVFLTDHPLFYQPDVFVRAGRNLEQFHNHVVFLLLTYADGLTARSSGDAEGARRRLAQCVSQAPRFTKARLALADALMDLGRYERARDEVAAVIEYAPDNPEALYRAAFVQVQMGHPDAAAPFLDLLLSQTGDPEMKDKARALQSYIKQGLPLKPGAPPG